MLVTTSKKATFSSLLSQPRKNRVFSNGDTIPIRHLKFNFDAQSFDDKFYLQKEWASAYFFTLSLFLTYGEDLVIDTARHHRQFITDPILKQRVTALIGQEAIHSKMHHEYNKILKQHHFPMELYGFFGKTAYNLASIIFPHALKLSAMASIEHFTAVLSEYMMKHEDNFYHSDDKKARALWMWHMLEESEHKDVAYDVYQTLNGNYALRLLGFSLALATIFGGVTIGAAAVPFLRKPSNLISWRFWKEAKSSVSLIFGYKNGAFGSTTAQVFEYIRPDFHPNDHDTSTLIKYYKAKLLHPETGILTPFFVKEFTPAVRAA